MPSRTPMRWCQRLSRRRLSLFSYPVGFEDTGGLVAKLIGLLPTNICFGATSGGVFAALGSQVVARRIRRLARSAALRLMRVARNIAEFHSAPASGGRLSTGFSECADLLAWVVAPTPHGGVSATMDRGVVAHTAPLGHTTRPQREVCFPCARPSVQKRSKARRDDKRVQLATSASTRN